MFDLDLTWVETKCPNCNYEAEVQLVDVKTERAMFCHNCKMTIELKDSDASVHSGIEIIETALKEFKLAFKKLGK